jgi:hypothetical protein
MIKLRAELKCYLCGRVAGELESSSGRSARFERFNPAPDVESDPLAPSRPAQCPRCGGGLFIDEVERVYLISTRPLKPEKRGRKPKRRPAAVAS